MVVAMELTADQSELFPNLETRATSKSLLRQSMDAVAEHGPLLPQHFLPSILGVSKQRVAQLIRDGLLATVRLQDHNFVPMAALELYMSETHKGGQPRKFSLVEQLRALSAKKL
jgi:hypothetical protein